MDDGVLIFHDPQGYVLVTDAGEHLHRVRGVVIHEHCGEGRDGGSQRLLLLPGLLVATIEGIGDQLRVGGEHLLIEDGGDLGDVRTNEREGLLDDLSITWG